jgi:DNA-binding CsgD family transcriptional regulator
VADLDVEQIRLGGDRVRVGVLLGRSAELGVADAMAAAARSGRGGVVSLEGGAGVGKTRLLETIAARTDGLKQLRAGGAQMERGFAYGLVSDLFESWPGFDEIQRNADPGLVGRLLVQRLSTAAASGPLLIAIDDLHWADGPSLRFVAQLCAHVHELAALVLLAWREPDAGRSQVRALLGAGSERVAMSRFTTSALAELAADAETAREQVAEEVTRRLAALGDDALAFAQAAAILGPHARLRSVASLNQLDMETAARLGDLLADAGAIRIGEQIAFTAPVLRDCVEMSIGRGRRAMLHSRAAELLVAIGADPVAIATHLLRAEPAGEAASARTLRAAARRVRLDGDPVLAGRLLERALTEPPPPDERTGVLLELGALEVRVRLPGGERHLARVVREGHPGQRCDAAVELATTELFAGRFTEARTLLESVIGACPAGAEDLSSVLQAELAGCETLACVHRHQHWWADGSEQLHGASPAERARLAVAAAGAAMTGESPETTVRLAQRALSAEPGDSTRTWPGLDSLLAIHALQLAEQPTAADRAIDRILSVARRSRWQVGEAALLSLRSRTALGRGRLRAAEADARNALTLCRGHGFELLVPLALASLVQALLDQGRPGEARRALESCDAADHGPDDYCWALLVAARGRLHAAVGDVHLGVRDLLAAGARLLHGACSTPTLDWRSSAGLLAHRLGRSDQAVRLIEDELILARGLGTPRPLGVALRAEAVMAPPANQIALLGESVDLLRTTPATLDTARSLCDLGAALRRSGSRRDARRPLQEALQLAHECGAEALFQRARRELLVAGARPRRYAITGVEALTARERQASELAAEGMTNREVATAMSVTPYTVEYHLTNAYRKLGIATRDELADELASPAN